MSATRDALDRAQPLLPDGAILELLVQRCLQDGGHGWTRSTYTGGRVRDDERICRVTGTDGTVSVLARKARIPGYGRQAWLIVDAVSDPKDEARRNRPQHRPRPRRGRDFRVAAGTGGSDTGEASICSRGVVPSQ